MLPNLVVLRQKCRECPLLKTFALRKSRPKFTKFGEQVSISQTPNRAKFCRAKKKVCDTSAVENLCFSFPHITLGQTMYDKKCTIKALQNFFSVLRRPAGTLCAKVHQSWPCTARPVPCTKLPNFVPFWKPLYEISAAKYGRFRRRRDPQKQSVNDVVSTHHAATKNVNKTEWRGKQLALASRMTYRFKILKFNADYHSFLSVIWRCWLGEMKGIRLVKPRCFTNLKVNQCTTRHDLTWNDFGKLGRFNKNSSLVVVFNIKFRRPSP